MSQRAPIWLFSDPAEPSAAGSTLRREVALLSRHRRLILLCTLVSSLAAAAYNYLARPLYESVAILSLDEAGGSPLRARGMVDLARRAEALEYQVRLLKSREIAILAVTDADPLIGAELSKGPLGGFVDRVVEETRLRFGFPFRHGASVAERASTFRSRLSVSNEAPSAWVYVTFRGYDPEAVVLAAQRLVDLYVATARREAQGDLGTTRQVIENRVAESRGKVVEAFGRLKEFDQKVGLEGRDARRLLLERELTRLQDSLLNTRQNLVSLKALAEESARLSADGLLAVPRVRDDEELLTARTQLHNLETQLAGQAATLGERHPVVVGLRSQIQAVENRLNGRLDVLRQSAATDYRLAIREEADLAARIQTTRDQIARLGDNALERSFIQKEAEAGQAAVGDLIQRAAREADLRIFFTPQVLQSPELARIPISPRRARNLEGALAFGLLSGILLAWLRAHLDETLKTPEEVKSAFTDPLLGMVPLVRSPGRDLFEPGVGPPTRLLEACQVLRTNLLATWKTSGAPPVLLITSSRAGEGKTTTACGIGVAMARTGLKVLLVDADLRRASLSRLFSANRWLGFSDAVFGTRLGACTMRTRVPGLSLLPCGTQCSDPPGLFNQPALERVLLEVRSHHDFVICDAPPVLAVADAAALARFCDQVLVVIGANATPVASVRASLDQLDAVGARVRGLILNGVDLRRDSHYYRYYYAPQYEDYSKPAAGGRSAPRRTRPRG